MFAPFLGLSVCPSAVISQKISNWLRGKQEKSNDLCYIIRNYKFINEAQNMTLHQARFLKAPLDLCLAKKEHLVDNAASLAFARGNSAVRVFFMDSTHYFAKS